MEENKGKNNNKQKQKQTQRQTTVKAFWLQRCSVDYGKGDNYDLLIHARNLNRRVFDIMWSTKLFCIKIKFLNFHFIIKIS